MTGKKYYLFAFLGPLFLPIIVMGIETAYGLMTNGGTEGQLSGFLIMSLLFGGIPYVIFLIGFYVWANDKDGKQIHRASYLVPLIYLPIFFCWLVFYYILVTQSVGVGDFFPLLISSELWSGFYVWGKIALALGYAYIFLFNIVYWILGATGILTS